MSNFLTDHGVVVALVCAAAAVVYGAVTSRALLALSPGNETMRGLSLAIQEGASAYLKRQYTVIGIVGVVLFVALIPLQNIEVAIGFAIGGLASASAGFIGMNVSVRANARVAEAARGGIGPALDVAFRGGAVTGMLVVGLALAGVAGYFGALTFDLRREHQGFRRRADRPRLRRLADLRLRPTRRRHLHQGRRRRRGHRRQDRGRHPRGRPAQPGRDRRQRGRQRRRLRRHGSRPVRDLRGHRGGRDAARHPHLRAGEPDPGRALPARPRRRLDHRLDHRDLRGQVEDRQRRARALPGHGRRRHHRGDRLLPDHLGDDGRPHAHRRPRRSQRRRPLPVRADRPRDHGAAVRDHRLLHVDALRPGQEDGQGLRDRPRHEHHPGPRVRPPGHRAARAGDRARHRRGATSSPASTASPSR